MHDLLVGAGGVKAGRLAAEMSNLECSPVVVVGGCGHRDPLSASEESREPAEGLWLLDSLPVSTTSTNEVPNPASRVSLFMEAALTTPPAVLCAFTLLGSVVLIEGSEVHCCATLRQYLKRLTVLANGDVMSGNDILPRPSTHIGSECAAFSKAAAADAVELAKDLRVHASWPCAMPQLRLVIVDHPSTRNPPSLSEVLAGTTASEIDAQLREAGEALFSSVVITRCQDSDSGSVTHDIVSHAPPKRLGLGARTLPASRWLALVADAYSRAQGWRHIKGRSTLRVLSDRVTAAIEAACAEYDQQNAAAADATASALTATVPAATAAGSGGGGTRPRPLLPPAPSHNTSFTSTAAGVGGGGPQQPGNALSSAADAAMADLLREIDVMKTRMATPRSRDELEAQALNAMRPLMQQLEAAIAAQRTSKASDTGAAEAVRLGQHWAEAVTRLLTEFRTRAGEDAAIRPVVNSIVADIAVQWALPNAAASSRLALDSVRGLAQQRVDELQTKVAMLELKAADAEARAVAAEVTPGPSAPADGEAALEIAGLKQRLAVAARHAETLEAKVAAFSADVAETTAFWKRRAASSEFLANNYTSPERRAHRDASAGLELAGVNRTADIHPPDARTPPRLGGARAGAVDEAEIKAELQMSYKAVATLGDKVAAFADDFARIPMPKYQPTGATSVGGGTLDASSIRESRVLAATATADVTKRIREARQAALATATRQAAFTSGATKDPVLSPLDSTGPAVSGIDPVGGSANASRGPSSGPVQVVPLHDVTAAGAARDDVTSHKDLAALRAALERATDALEHLQGAYDARCDEVDRQAEALADANAHVESSRGSITRLMEDNAVLRGEVTRLLQTLGDHEVLKRKLADTERQLADTEQQVRVRDSTIDAFSSDKRRLEDGMVNANENRTALERKIRDMEAELASCRETNDANDDRIRDLEQELYAAQSARKLAENNCESLRTEIDVVTAEFKECEQQLAELRTRNEQLVVDGHARESASSETRRELQQQLDDVKREVEETRASAAAVQQEQEVSILRLRQQSVQQETQLKDALAREHKANQAHSTAYSDLTTIIVERDALRATVEDRERRVERASKSLSLLRDENRQLRQRSSTGSGLVSASGSPPRLSTAQSRHVSPDPWRLMPADTSQTSGGGGYQQTQTHTYRGYAASSATTAPGAHSTTVASSAGDGAAAAAGSRSSSTAAGDVSRSTGTPVDPVRAAPRPLPKSVTEFLP